MTPENIIVHCSATPDGHTLSWDDIRRFHVVNRGWNDIGYHFGIEEYQGQLVLLQGRRPNEMGAHCRAHGRNHDSLGVCIVGDFDNRPVPLPKYLALVRLLTMLSVMFHIPAENIYGHREFEVNKTCPGLAVDLWQLRDDVGGRLIKEGDEKFYALFPNL